MQIGNISFLFPTIDHTINRSDKMNTLSKNVDIDINKHRIIFLAVFNCIQ